MYYGRVRSNPLTSIIKISIKTMHYRKKKKIKFYSHWTNVTDLTDLKKKVSRGQRKMTVTTSILWWKCNSFALTIQFSIKDFFNESKSTAPIVTSGQATDEPLLLVRLMLWVSPVWLKGKLLLNILRFVQKQKNHHVPDLI